MNYKTFRVQLNNNLLRVVITKQYDCFATLIELLGLFIFLFNEFIVFLKEKLWCCVARRAKHGKFGFTKRVDHKSRISNMKEAFPNFSRW